ncbi:tRNA guanosine-2'-O-methyltransferase [Marchantia polymorpha subsp. ruderalis]
MERFLLLLLALTTIFAMPALGSKSYVVYMGGRSQNLQSASASHHQMLSTVMDSSEAASEAMMYVYHHFHGFAAKLTPEQAATLAERDEVVSVFPNRKHILHTTRSWEFLGLEDSEGKLTPNSLWNKSNFGKDVIIGVLDTGVWPESASYRDDGFGPIPARWKGECVAGDEFNASYCNRKLIGGRFFIRGYESEEGPLNTTRTGDFRSARDMDGHGTHTSSTAGGNFVEGANTLGFAKGTAKGGAPLARVAMYKVCWPSTAGSGGCYDSDILAAFDAGIEDGVIIFSVSLGTSPPLPAFYEDGIAIGSFHAMEQGITTIASAGNSGPTPGTVANVAPWMITVAASSIDRDFTSYVTLGNNVTLKGESLANEKLEDKFYPLIDSTTAFAADSNASQSQLCLAGSLDPAKVKGKVVACLRGITARVDKGEQVKLAGGVGLILINPPSSGNELVSDPHVLPGLNLGSATGDEVYKYISSTKSPVARLIPATTVLGVKPAPVLTAFSSQGPNTLVPDINKPDITGPGLNILAAFTEAISITDLPSDNRVVKFNIISGTSMSCPHVAGVSASLKALHPNWSPAAIQSAIITTASTMDNQDKLIKDSTLKASNPFGVGAGQVNPNSAAAPGLIYDRSYVDYFPFFCALSYTSAQIRSISGEGYTCPTSKPLVSSLNYPSLTVSSLRSQQIVMRTVTNVGSANSEYTVSITSPPGTKVVISPSTLKFSALGEKLSFMVTITKVSDSPRYGFGSYTWSDGTYSVRSPITVKTAARTV